MKINEGGKIAYDNGSRHLFSSFNTLASRFLGCLHFAGAPIRLR